MMFEWDDTKAAVNLAKHGVKFDAVYAFDWHSAIERVDDRAEHLELRMVAIGFIGASLHVLIYTPRGDKVRVISLRRASAREMRAYENAQT